MYVNIDDCWDTMQSLNLVQADSEDSDQTGRKPNLIQLLAWSTDHFGLFCHCPAHLVFSMFPRTAPLALIFLSGLHCIAFGQGLVDSIYQPGFAEEEEEGGGEEEEGEEHLATAAAYE